MSTRTIAGLMIAIALLAPSAFANPPATSTATVFPRQLVEWKPLPGNPVFAGAGRGRWDAAIRERGWILREGGTFHLWYTGYDGSKEGIKQLGYATSPDGLHWTRSKENPLCRGRWVEDMMVVREGGMYYMFAEGPTQSASQMLTSEDRVHWKAEGVFDIRLTDGRRVEPPFGTPTVWVENGTWHLFYERGDLGVWLAITREPRSLRWTNVQDEPVLAPGPREYDREQIALDQVIKYKSHYYAFYHASGSRDAAGNRLWNTNIARSSDLVHWEKYSGNPLVEDNKSSGILVPAAVGCRLYTMNGQVDAFESPRE